MGNLKGITILLALVALAAALTGVAACSKEGRPVAVKPEGGVFRIDAGGIKNGQARFYSYRVKDKDVVFFVARDRGGDIRTSLDACITCYSHRKGYRLERDCVVCVYCGTVIPIDKLDAGIGNCVPIKLRHTLEADTVIISLAEVEDGARWF